MTEHDDAPDIDDTEGHGRPHGARDDDEDDTEGHGRPHGA
jgi:hypothetical protein